MKGIAKFTGCFFTAIILPVVCILCSVVLFFEGLRQSLASNPLTYPMALLLDKWMNAPYSGDYNPYPPVPGPGPIPGGCGFTPYSNLGDVLDQQAACMLPLGPGTRRSGTDYGVQNGNYCPHYGIDLANGYDHPVYAIMGGKIAFDGWSPIGFGHLIIVENMGYQFYYAHLECGIPCDGQMYTLCSAGWQPEFTKGDTINTGQQIGIMGCSSWVGQYPSGYPTAQGSHLHFEVHDCRNDGEKCVPVNPRFCVFPGAEGCNLFRGLN